MICRYATPSRYPTVFLKMTGLRLNEFEELLTDVLPRFATAQQQRLTRPARQRAPVLDATPTWRQPTRSYWPSSGCASIQLTKCWASCSA
jgi:hypothetical protein